MESGTSLKRDCVRFTAAPPTFNLLISLFNANIDYGNNIMLEYYDAKDKELEVLRNFVNSLATMYLELSHDKAAWELAEIKKKAQKIVQTSY